MNNKTDREIIEGIVGNLEEQGFRDIILIAEKDEKLHRIMSGNNFKIIGILQVFISENINSIINAVKIEEAPNE